MSFAWENEILINGSAMTPKKKLILAMACYAALATMAGATLDGNLRLVVWIVLAGLALKTWIADLRLRTEREEPPDA